MTEGANGHDTADEPDESTEPTLADLLDDLADEFADIERREGPTGVDYLVREQPFARRNGLTAQFRLRPEIVAAGGPVGVGLLLGATGLVDCQVLRDGQGHLLPRDHMRDQVAGGPAVHAVDFRVQLVVREIGQDFIGAPAVAFVFKE
jgi:hypothetical protein